MEPPWSIRTSSRTSTVLSSLIPENQEHFPKARETPQGPKHFLRSPEPSPEPLRKPLWCPEPLHSKRTLHNHSWEPPHGSLELYSWKFTKNPKCLVTSGTFSRSSYILHHQQNLLSVKNLQNILLRTTEIIFITWSLQKELQNFHPENLHQDSRNTLLDFKRKN